MPPLRSESGQHLPEGPQREETFISIPIESDPERAKGSNATVEITREGYTIHDPTTLEKVATVTKSAVVKKRPRPSKSPESPEARAFNNERVVYDHLLAKAAERMRAQAALGFLEACNPAAPQIYESSPQELETEYIRGATGGSLRFGDNAHTAVAVARQLMEAHMYLLKDDIAYLDVKPENFKAVIDWEGTSQYVRFFDFGNAALVEGGASGNIVPNPALRIEGFPPEVLNVVLPGKGIKARLAKFGVAEQPVNASKAIVYATGFYFANHLVIPTVFDKEFPFNTDPTIIELQKITRGMLAQSPARRLSFPDAYRAIKALEDPSKVGSCVSPSTLKYLQQRGEVLPGKELEEILARTDYSRMEPLS